MFHFSFGFHKMIWYFSYREQCNIILRKFSICSVTRSNEESRNESPIYDDVQIAMIEVGTDRTKRKSQDTLQTIDEID